MATGGISGRRGFVGIAATSSGTASKIGEIRGWAVEASQAEIDVSSNDSSGWNEFLQGQRSWTMTADAIYLSAEADQVLLRETLSSGATRHMTIRPTTGGSALWRGTGFVTRYSVRGTHDGAALFDFEFRGTRAFTYTT